MIGPHEIVPAAGTTQNIELIRYFKLLLASPVSLSASDTVATPFTLVSSASATTMTLPTASGFIGQLTIKNINTGIVTVDGAGSETIDGRLTIGLYKNNSITIISDGSNWQIIAWVNHVF
jgi:hypothetical protein